MMELDFTNNYEEKYDYLEDHFLTILDIVSKKLSLKGNYYLDVVLTNNEEIHKINKEYRGIDRPTDVISFAFEDESNDLVKIKNPEVIFLGEIIISIDKCKEQAVEYQHSFDRESAFLFTHGVLHLLGYDHQNEDDEKKMFSLQDEILEDTIWKRKN